MSSLRIHRYILKEIITPTVLSLLIFTAVLLMGKLPKLAELIINKGVPAGEILQLFGYLMPTFFIITIPLSFLLGILLAFGRLSADSEFIALKATGVSLYSLVKPVIVVGLLLCILTAWITIIVEPASKAAFRSKLFNIATNSASVSVKSGVFNDNFPGVVLYARQVDEQRGIMHDVFISDERNGETPAIITAQQGRFISDKKKLNLTLRLSDGDIHRRPHEDDGQTYQIIRFKNYDINFDLGQQLKGGKKHRKSRGELSWSELKQAIQTAKSTKSKAYYQSEKYYRIVLSFSPFILVLIGVPLGLQSQRSGKGAGFALALVVFLVYYVLLNLATTIADEGIIPAAIILWLPNFILFSGGSLFLYRTAIEKPFNLLQHPQLLFSWLRKNKNRGDNDENN